MAISENIISFGNNSANYGALVGQSLQQLGQQVGQTLAMQEYRKQAAAQLPFISQQMQLATREASEGKFGDAYSKIIGLTADPSVTQNPFILPALEMGMQAIKQGSSQAWFNLQNRQQGGGGGTTGPMGFRVPSAEELSDPNANIESDVVYAEGGIPGMGGGTSFGAGVLQGTEEQRRQQAEADRMYGPPVDPDVQAERDLMALQPDGQGGRISFGFGTISQFKPKDDVIEATQDEILRYKGLSQEDKADYTARLIETDAEYTPPQGRKAEPFQGIIGFDGVSYIEGPVTGGQKVTGIEEEYSQRTGKKVKRTLEPADKADEQTFDAFVKNIDQANRFVSRNPQLRKIVEATGGDLTRVDIQDEENPETGEMVFKAYVEGKDMGILSTQENFNEKAALEMLADAPAVMRRNGWKPIRSQAEAPTEAPAAGAPQTTADKVRAKFGKTEQAAPAAPTAAPAKELTLAEQITATASAPEPSAPPTPRKQPERRGVAAAQASQRLTKERDELRRALYQVTGRGEVRGLKKGLDPENPIVKKGIERLKEIEKELASL